MDPKKKKKVRVLCTLIHVYLGWPLKQKKNMCVLCEKEKKEKKNTKTVCVLCTLILVYLRWPLKQNFLNCVSSVD